MIHELKTKEGNSTGLWAVEVPASARGFEYIENLGRLTYIFEVNKITQPYWIKLTNTVSYSILGLVTRDTVAPQITEPELDGGMLIGYTEEAFRSLLFINGLYWENPYENEEDVLSYEKLYLIAESKLLGDKNLLILKKI